ncbi:MAG: tetratricopeptide repeat protein [Opitutaceae bacterium]|nr:tetratricopeptide repeat protein [Opitutaceae bacterium]
MSSATANPPPQPAARLHWAIIATLVLTTVAAYWNSLAVPFFFDDKPAILHNPTIRQLWPLTAVLNPPQDGSSVTGRPLLNLSLAINYALGGTEPRGYHIFNLLIHALAGLTLYGVVRRTLLLPALRDHFGHAARLVAFTIAALWVLHPLQTESVTNVIQRTESLVGLFYLLTFYCFVRGLDSSRPRLWLTLCVISSLAGMATKEVMVTAPVLILLFDRALVAGTLAAAWRLRRSWYLGLAASWLLLIGLLIQTGGTRGEGAGLGLGATPWDYLLTQCRAIVLYLKLSFWPHPLVMDYGTDLVGGPAEVWWQGILLVALAGLTVIAWRRWPKAGFVGAAFFVILSPSSSVVPLVSQTIAEHRMYLPLAAVIVAVVLLLHQRMGRTAVIVLLCAAPVLGTLTHLRNRDYRSELALWTDTAAKVPANARAQINLAEILIKEGRPTEALVAAENAVRLRPNYPEAQNNLAIALIQTGRPQAALTAARRAVELKPDYAGAHSSLGIVLAQLGRLPEAIQHFEAALRLAPGSGEAPGLHYNLANALLKSGRFTEAIGHYRTALQHDPGLAEAHFNLAHALGMSGRYPEAEAELETTLQIDPHHARARAILETLRAGPR